MKAVTAHTAPGVLVQHLHTTELGIYHGLNNCGEAVVTFPGGAAAYATGYVAQVDEEALR